MKLTIRPYDKATIRTYTYTYISVHRIIICKYVVS